MKRTEIRTWNPQQPFINGCFNWMIPNLYIGNGCFTKHPFLNGCLGLQVVFSQSHFSAFRKQLFSRLALRQVVLLLPSILEPQLGIFASLPRQSFVKKNVSKPTFVSKPLLYHLRLLLLVLTSKDASRKIKKKQKMTRAPEMNSKSKHPENGWGYQGRRGFCPFLLGGV